MNAFTWLVLAAMVLPTLVVLTVVVWGALYVLREAWRALGEHARHQPF